MSDIRYGVPVPWYRVNGWHLRAGHDDRSRWELHVLGVVIARTPWFPLGVLS